MDRTERFYKIDQLLDERRIVPFSVFEEKLGVSRATIKRDLEYLRNRLNAPIVWDREQGGYRFEAPARGAGQYELPGLWFNASEIHALLTMQHLLTGLDTGGLLGPHIQPLLARLRALLGTGDDAADEIQKRIRILGVNSRRMALDHFAVVGSALLRRKRLLIDYYVRSRDEVTAREISPQRLVHYRDNWYLDAWCHLRGEVRSFAVDAIRRVEILEARSRNVPDRTLDAILGSGYGIFSGRKVQWARLKFGARRARWVANERWHPRQKGCFGEDGSYFLDLPYSDHRELVMDILRFGGDVEVLAPLSLRQRVIDELGAARTLYGIPPGQES
ncbi:MAG: YafY family transcriptional regulator [Candidatus Nitricoxidivorans perseverans]|uniref:YafY family transcriptional regulator n=1 Tax=Candidatus Nitricoxidivorans perseverans TaxID=2975601 RepID=A0AA49FLS5_9PROT|nr:MAG: YafY family transcriptional regulator [Candidatus Nitricoxidivorans perseverans]